MRIGGVVLCGGKSSRMGYPKALLPFGPELMLQRVVRLLSAVVSPIVVVAAGVQSLPELPADVLMARDDQAERGPLEGLRAGLAMLGSQVEAAYATSCDVPLLDADFVRYMIDQLPEHDVTVPVEEKFHHPLAAVYRTSVVPHLQELLAQDRLRPIFLYERVKTRRVPVEELRRVDPELQTLTNLNHADEYFAALQSAGYEVTREIRSLVSQQNA